MEKVFEKISDFHGKEFFGLWGDFNCRCYVNEDVVFVTFFKTENEESTEKFFIKGNNAIDLLDFVLSEYYKEDNVKIEDCFSCWLFDYYNKEVDTIQSGKVEYNTDLPFDDLSWEERYKSILSDWEKQGDNIRYLCRTIRRKNKHIKKLETQIRELKKQLTSFKTNNLHN